MCGLGEAGDVVCIEQGGDVVRAELPEGVERVEGDIVVSKTGGRYLAARVFVDGHRQFQLQSLEALEAYDRIIARPARSMGYPGWFALGAENSKHIHARPDCGKLEDCLGSGSTPLPMLDGLHGIEDVVHSDYTGGCALLSEGRVDCWDAEGNPTSRRHAADGRGTHLVPVAFEDSTEGFCVSTKDAIVCESFGHAGRTRTLSLPGVREISEYRGQLCALAEQPGLVCLRTVLQTPVPTRVPALDPVRQMTAGAQGWCAVTETGALVCWGEPFSPHQSSVAFDQPRLDHPYPAPTPLASEGVDGFWLSKSGGSWCISRQGRVRCEDNGWARTHTLGPNDELVETALRELCVVSNGTVRCLEARQDEPTPGLVRAAKRGGVTAIGLGLSASSGCVARGRELTCWNDHDRSQNPGGPKAPHLPRFTLPADISGIAVSGFDVTLSLADGRVMHRDDESPSFQALPDLRVSNFHATEAGAWSGVDDHGLVCGNDEFVEHYPWPDVRWGECQQFSACVIDGAGAVHCWGSQSRGMTGQGWDPLQLTHVPMRPDEPLRNVE
jgi:hypothetical protein